jgi:hypothetical protein
MLKLVMSTKRIKNKPTQNKIPIKKYNVIVPNTLIHPVNSLLLDVVTKKPLKSCGCGK